MKLLSLPLVALLACSTSHHAPEADQVLPPPGPIEAPAVAHAAGAFHAVDIGGRIEVGLAIGSESKFEIAGPHAADVSVHVIDGALVVKAPDGDDAPRITITTPALDKIMFGGTGHLHATALTGADLLAVVTGTGDMTLAGTVDSAILAVHGHGNLDATRLVSGHNTTVTTNGGSIRSAGNVTVAGQNNVIQSNVGGVNIQSNTVD